MIMGTHFFSHPNTRMNDKKNIIFSSILGQVESYIKIILQNVGAIH
jgi:hypothetical protein